MLGSHEPYGAHARTPTDVTCLRSPLHVTVTPPSSLNCPSAKAPRTPAKSTLNCGKAPEDAYTRSCLVCVSSTSQTLRYVRWPRACPKCSEYSGRTFGRAEFPSTSAPRVCNHRDIDDIEGSSDPKPLESGPKPPSSGLDWLGRTSDQTTLDSSPRFACLSRKFACSS